MEEQGFNVPRGRGRRGDLYQEAYETQFKFSQALMQQQNGQQSL